jgi:hypothetical protein
MDRQDTTHEPDELSARPCVFVVRKFLPAPADSGSTTKKLGLRLIQAICYSENVALKL